MTYIEAYISKRRLLNDLTVASAEMFPGVVAAILELADLSIDLAIQDELHDR